MSVVRNFPELEFWRRSCVSPISRMRLEEGANECADNKSHRLGEVRRLWSSRKTPADPTICAWREKERQEGGMEREKRILPSGIKSKKTPEESGDFCFCADVVITFQR